MITCHILSLYLFQCSTPIYSYQLYWYILDGCGRGGTCHFLGCFRTSLIVVKFGQKGSCTWDPVVVKKTCLLLYNYRGVIPLIHRDESDKPSNQDPYEPISISCNVTNPSVACWKYHPSTCSLKLLWTLTNLVDVSLIQHKFFRQTRIMDMQGCVLCLSVATCSDNLTWRHPDWWLFFFKGNLFPKKMYQEMLSKSPIVTSRVCVRGRVSFLQLINTYYI